MDIDQLRTFLAVLEHGGFSRAAEALRVGQSTVSFHIKALEAAAGTRLLDRRGRQVRITAAGRVLRRYALRIVALREEALSRLGAEERGETGRITIAASTIPGEYLVPRALARFRRSHPGVAVVVDVSDSRRALASLIAQECDVALVGARPRDRRVVASAFADDQVVLVAAAPHATRITAEELARAPLILREEGSGTREAVSAIVARGEGGAAGPAPIQVGTNEAAKRCVLSGAGLTFISRLAVADELRDGRLEIVELPGTPARRSFYAARLRTVTLSPAARAFLRILHQENR